MFNDGAEQDEPEIHEAPGEKKHAAEDLDFHHESAQVEEET
jgi:hypothetical protein